MDLPLKFPDRHEENRRRMLEFQQLPFDERLRQIADTYATGMILIRESPNRRAIERLIGMPESGHHPTDQPPQAVPDLMEGVLQLAGAARRANVRYAVIGGLAAGYWTYTPFYREIAVLLDILEPDFPLLLDDLTARGFTCVPQTTTREWTQEHMTTVSFRGVRIDCLRPVIPLYQHVLDRATDASVLNQPIQIATAEGLILIKMLAYRPQDVVDIENLGAAHRDTLDMEWIKSEWATVAALDDPRMVRLEELVEKRGCSDFRS